MSDWFTTKEGILDRLWQVLADGVADATHPARLPAFATTAVDGAPEVRTVVLRNADRAKPAVTVHTDLHSDKIASLRGMPRAALMVWVPDEALQIRLQTTVDIQHGPAVRDLWDKIPDHAQQSYGVTPPPGTPISDALAYVKEPDPDTFAVLTCQVSLIDAVYLGEHHRRVRYSRESEWRGQWLSP